MKNLSLGLVLFLLGASLLLSCKKTVTDAPSQFPVTVYATGFAPKYNMRMYVGGIEITDTVKIKKFFSNVPAIVRPSSILTNMPSYTFNATDSLQLPGALNTSYTFDNATGKHIFTITNFSSVDPSKFSFDATKFYLYPPTSKAVSGGFNVTSSLIGYNSYTSFKASVLNFKYRKSSNGFTTATLGSNEFNAASLSTMAPNDSIAVQEFFVYYAPKPTI